MKNRMVMIHKMRGKNLIVKDLRMVNKNFNHWLKDILHPEKMQYQDVSMDDIRQALQNHAVQNLWLNEIILKIQQMNMEVDNLLSKEDKQRIWETFAIERRTLLACLRMILDAKDTLESEREALEHQNRKAERIVRATAVSLDLRQSE